MIESHCRLKGESNADKDVGVKDWRCWWKMTGLREGHRKKISEETGGATQTEKNHTH
jgi:hypothetical protein